MTNKYEIEFKDYEADELTMDEFRQLSRDAREQNMSVEEYMDYVYIIKARRSDGKIVMLGIK